MSLNWVAQTAIVTNEVVDAACDLSGNTIAACNSAGSVLELFRSTDGGASWTSVYTQSGWTAICATFANGLLVVAAHDGSGIMQIIFSSDGGTTWNVTSCGDNVQIIDIVYIGSDTWVVISANRSYYFYSTDNFATISEPSPGGFYSACSTIWTGTEMQAMGRNPATGNFATAINPTGIGAWGSVADLSPQVTVVAQNIGTPAYQSMFLLFNGLYIYPASDGSDSPSIIYASAFAGLAAPTEVTLPSPSGSGSAYKSVATSALALMASNTSGDIWESTDGVTWSHDTLPSFPVPVYGLVYDSLNGYFIAIGTTGPVANAAVLATVPNVVGELQATAEADIVSAGFSVGSVTTGYDPTIPAGDVASQSPVGGTSAALGTPVDLVTSLGPAPASVAISPTSATVVIGGEQVFTYSTVSPADASVTWSALYGTVNNGVYVAPSNLAHTDDFVTVTRMDDGLTATAEVSLVNKTVTVQAGYRGPKAFPPVLLIQVPTINPKIYMPVENTTVVAK
jgi:hypothetical protein